MKLAAIEWVIVQAGGKGARLEHLTNNKPKCLLSVHGRPLLYHLFERFPDASFVVIGDYRYEVLENYLQVVKPSVPVSLIKAASRGTAAGLGQALSQLPDDAPFVLVWSDLLIDALPDAQVEETNLVGLSRSFACRWSYSKTAGFSETPSQERGVAGFFVFTDRLGLRDVPDGGELTRWLAQTGAVFDPLYLDEVSEVGSISAFSAQQDRFSWSRFFNEVEVLEDRVIKRPRQNKFAHKLELELAWYRAVAQAGFDRVPAVLCAKPLTLARIQGIHPFELPPDSRRQAALLEALFEQLGRLHDCGDADASPETCAQVYLDKTLQRAQSVRGLIPHFDEPEATYQRASVPQPVPRPLPRMAGGVGR